MQYISIYYIHKTPMKQHFTHPKKKKYMFENNIFQLYCYCVESLLMSKVKSGLCRKPVENHWPNTGQSSSPIVQCAICCLKVALQNIWMFDSFPYYSIFLSDTIIKKNVIFYLYIMLWLLVCDPKVNNTTSRGSLDAL